MITGASAMRREDPRLEAAQKRLRESLDRADTLEAIREIVTNLLGCEEIGLFTLAQEDGDLLWSFGIDPQIHGRLNSFEAAAVDRVRQGELHVARVPAIGKDKHANPPLRVFVPIFRNGRAVGVLVMVTLLPQKTGFDEADMNLLTLLSDETGKALFSAGDGRD